MKIPNSKLRTSPGSFASLGFTAMLLLIAGCSGAVASSGERVKLVLTPVPTPSQTAPAAATIAPVTYTVKAGDTLWDIANLFGVTLDDIIRSNNIADPGSLSEGQVLTVPIRPPTITPGSASTVTVLPGGTQSPAPALQTGTPGTPGASGTPGTPAGPSPSPTLPPPNATPPQGPVIKEPTENSSAPGPTISPTAIP